MHLKIISVFVLLITTISLPAQIIKTVVGTTCGTIAGDGQYRIYYTLSTQLKPDFYTSWGNIEKTQ